LYKKTLVARYLLYGFIALEVLLLPKLVSEEVYTSFEYYKNLIFIFPFVLLGSYSGFIYTKYTKGSDDFDSLMVLGFCFSLIGATIFCLIIRSFWVFIPLLVINLFTMAEQKLKVEKRFIAAFSFKPLLSVIVLLVSGSIFAFTTKLNLQTWQLLNGGFLGAFCIWFMFGRSSFDFSKMSLSIPQHYKKYLILVKKGFPIATGSILLTLLFFSDRYIIANYYEEHLATYSFSFNLSQMLVMALSTIAYVSAVDLGERKDILNKEYLKKIFLRGLIFYVVLLILMIPGLLIIREFYPYQNLFTICLLLTYSKGLYFLLTTLSSVILYFDYQWHSFWALLAIVAINFVVLFVIQLIGYSVFSLLFFSGLSLFIYTSYTYYLIFHKIEYSILE